MKKEIKKNKLSLTKMTITKLTNPYMIRGGNDTDGSGEKDKAEYEWKCINNSAQQVLVKKKQL